MRVLHVLDHSLPLQSGYTFRTLKILQQQHRMGIETFHVTGLKQEECHDLKEEIQGLTFYRTPHSKSWLKKLPLIKQWAAVKALQHRLMAVVEEVNPDVLHVHSPVLNGLAALKVARRRNIPIVYEIRAFWEDAAVDHGTHRANGLRYKLSRALESYMTRKAQHVTTICDGLKTDLLGRGLTQERITVIPNAVDHEFFMKQNFQEADHEKLLNDLQLKNKFVIGFIGSFYAYEGLDLLIDAIHTLKSRLPHLRVLLIGGGPEAKNLYQQVKRLNLQEQVILLSRIPHEKVPLYYQCLDYCIFPRRKMRLTDLVTPLKPLEAMARGVPVLASDVGGHRELIEDKTTGFLFEADSVTACAQAIFDAVHQSKPMEIIYKAQNYIIETRNWQVSTEHYREVYEKALSA